MSQGDSTQLHRPASPTLHRPAEPDDTVATIMNDSDINL